jgi:hypothetical protein
MLYVIAVAVSTFAIWAWLVANARADAVPFE